MMYNIHNKDSLQLGLLFSSDVNKDMTLKDKDKDLPGVA